MTNKSKAKTKKEGKKKKQAMVVAIPRPVRRSGAQLSHHCKKAMVAATNPFHPAAEGVAEVDDTFSRNLHRFPVNFGAKMTTDSNGDIAFVLLPSLYCSGLAVKGTTNTPVGYTFAAESNSNIPRPDVAVTINSLNSQSYYGIQAMPNLFSAQYAKHRIVRWGVVIRSIPNMSTNQGRVRLAKIQPGGYVPLSANDVNEAVGGAAAGDQAYFSSGTGATATVSTRAMDSGRFLNPYIPSLARYLYNIGVPVRNPGSTTSIGTNTITVASNPDFTYEDMARMPGNVSMTVAGLTAQGLLVRGKRTDVNSLKGTMLTAATAGGVVSDANMNSQQFAGGYNTYIFGGQHALDISVLDCTGHDGLVIRVDSAAASTALLDIEIVYHVEASLRGAASNQFGRAAAEPIITSPSDAHALRAVEHRAPHFVAVPTAFRELLTGAVEGLAKRVESGAQAALSSTLSGVLTRALAGISL